MRPIMLRILDQQIAIAGADYDDLKERVDAELDAAEARNAALRDAWHAEKARLMAVRDA